MRGNKDIILKSESKQRKKKGIINKHILAHTLALLKREEGGKSSPIKKKGGVWVLKKGYTEECPNIYIEGGEGQMKKESGRKKHQYS